MAASLDLWYPSIKFLPYLTEKTVALYTQEAPFRMPKENLSPRGALYLLAGAPPSAGSLLASLPHEIISTIARYIPPMAPVVLNATEAKHREVTHTFGGPGLRYHWVVLTIDLRVDD